MVPRGPRGRQAPTGERLDGARAVVLYSGHEAGASVGRSRAGRGGEGEMKVGFIGTGSMGRPMLRNLVTKGFPVVAYDVQPAALEAAARLGASPAGSAAAAAARGRPPRHDAAVGVPRRERLPRPPRRAGGRSRRADSASTCPRSTPRRSQRVAARLRRARSALHRRAGLGRGRRRRGRDARHHGRRRRAGTWRRPARSSPPWARTSSTWARSAPARWRSSATT